MLKSPTPPKKLFALQKWFGNLISQPLTFNHKIPSFTPQGNSIEEEAAQFISPSHTLNPHQRIEIYYQQYWWRLLNVMQENFPTVTRLFGYDDFNQKIAIPYLSDQPPQHWALCELGKGLFNWIQNHYRENDFNIVSTTVDIDWSALKAFWSKQEKAINPQTLTQEETSALLHQSIYLQPHISLFELFYDFFSFREIFLQKTVEFWKDHSFPELKKEHSYFVIYRHPKNYVAWKKISKAEHFILSYIHQGKTIEETLGFLEEQGGEPYEEASNFLPLWFRDWISLGWFWSA